MELYKLRKYELNQRYEATRIAFQNMRESLVVNTALLILVHLVDMYFEVLVKAKGGYILGMAIEFWASMIFLMITQIWLVLRIASIVYECAIHKKLKMFRGYIERNGIYTYTDEELYCLVNAEKYEQKLEIFHTIQDKCDNGIDMSEEDIAEIETELPRTDNNIVDHNVFILYSIRISMKRLLVIVGIVIVACTVVVIVINSNRNWKKISDANQNLTIGNETMGTYGYEVSDKYEYKHICVVNLQKGTVRINVLDKNNQLYDTMVISESGEYVLKTTEGYYYLQIDGDEGTIATIHSTRYRKK